MEAIRIQECGCIAIPDSLAESLGMQPGVMLDVAVDPGTRSVTLTVPPGAGHAAAVAAATCPVKP